MGFRVGQLLAIAWGLVVAGAQEGDFSQHQNSAPRVQQARTEKAQEVRALFAKAQVAYPARRLLLRAFKADNQLELWAGDGQGPLTLVTTYAICARSGSLGPKRMQGDGQVPEGFYVVDRFNPTSNFHLSLGVSYPNTSDRQLGRVGHLGGDIFIHGDCVTIGCIPIETEPIKALYLIALDTKLTFGSTIAVQIFPTRMTAEGLQRLHNLAQEDTELWAFWQNLVPGYTYFEEHHLPAPVVVDPKTGRYRW